MEGVPAWGPRLQALQGAFVNSYVRANPDMQGDISYEPEAPGKANLAVCSNQVSHRYNCLAVTFEQPFKDCATMPDEPFGWTDKRCSSLGASLVNVMAHVQPYLRTDEPFWETMDVRDAYKRPKEGSASVVVERRRFAEGVAGKASDAGVAAVDAQLREAQVGGAPMRGTTRGTRWGGANHGRGGDKEGRERGCLNARMGLPFTRADSSPPRIAGCCRRSSCPARSALGIGG